MNKHSFLLLQKKKEEQKIVIQICISCTIFVHERVFGIKFSNLAYGVQIIPPTFSDIATVRAVIASNNGGNATKDWTCNYRCITLLLYTTYTSACPSGAGPLLAFLWLQHIATSTYVIYILKLFIACRIGHKICNFFFNYIHTNKEDVF